MNKHLSIVVDPKKGEMVLTDYNGDTLTTDKFLTDTNGLLVKTLNYRSICHILSFLMKYVWREVGL